MKAPEPPAVTPFEILVTESPVTEYDSRTVLDGAQIRFGRLHEPQALRLTGERPEHEFWIQARHAGFYSEVRIHEVLHGHLRSTVVTRNRSDLKVDRLWIGRHYIHGDSGRACFPAPAQPRDFQGEVWFATLDPDTERVASESQVKFGFGRSSAGHIRETLHSGHEYSLRWRAHRDGEGRDYRASWFRGGELLSETLESVFPMKEAVAAGCLALRKGQYCDTDYI
ncbi:MAG TPA: hypothetical protein VF529_05465 [Solirubrobacteraceae bacterium]